MIAKPGCYFLRSVAKGRPCPNQGYGILDTHILTHMRNDLGIPTPKATPPSPKKYYELEAKLLAVVKASGKSYADYDLEVWSKRVLDKKAKAAKIPT